MASDIIDRLRSEMEPYAEDSHLYQLCKDAMVAISGDVSQLRIGELEDAIDRAAQHLIDAQSERDYYESEVIRLEAEIKAAPDDCDSLRCMESDFIPYP